MKVLDQRAFILEVSDHIGAFGYGLNHLKTAKPVCRQCFCEIDDVPMTYIEGITEEAASLNHYDEACLAKMLILRNGLDLNLTETAIDLRNAPYIPAFLELDPTHTKGQTVHIINCRVEGNGEPIFLGGNDDQS